MNYLLASALLLTGLPLFATTVKQFAVAYEMDYPQQIPVDQLFQVPIWLAIGPDGYRAPLENDPVICVTLETLSMEPTPPRFEKSALQTICSTLVAYFNSRGIDGVSVTIADRPSYKKAITLRIHFAILGEMGISRMDCKKRGQKNLDFILSGSPIQPACETQELFSKQGTDEYLYFLNRHPNRRVDARVYSLYQDSKIGLEYLLDDAKPWLCYFDVTNTGTKQTGRWEETFGVVNTQFTGVDDIFRLDWTTDSFHSFYTIAGSYDRPLLFAHKIRWKLFGMFNRYAASELGFQDKAFVGTQGIGALSFQETVFQKQDFFIDFVEGFRYFNMDVTNRLSLTNKHGTSQFVEPTFSLRFEKTQNRMWRIWSTLDLQGSAEGFLASSRKNIDSLGRINASKNWAILNGNFFASFYVDPVSPVNEFAFLFQGQWAFHYRLIPQLKFVVGGFNTVRGYPESMNSGDDVALARAEYLFHLPPLLSPRAPRKWLGKCFRYAPEACGGRADWDLILRLFLDAAYSHDNKIIQPIEANTTMIGTGLSLELDLWQNFMIRGDWGIALHKALEVESGHNAFYFNTSVAY